MFGLALYAFGTVRAFCFTLNRIGRSVGGSTQDEASQRPASDDLAIGRPNVHSYGAPRENDTVLDRFIVYES